MLRALVPVPYDCSGISAQCPGRDPGAGDAPVSPEVAAVARLVESDPSRDRARFMSDLTRLLFKHPPQRTPALTLLRSGQPATALPRPGPAAGARAADCRLLEPGDLSTCDRRRSTRRRHHRRPPGVVAVSYARGVGRRDARVSLAASRHPDARLRGQRGVLSAFGASLHIRDGRVAPPGGDTAIPLWEAALGEHVDAPRSLRNGVIRFAWRPACLSVRHHRAARGSECRIRARAVDARIQPPGPTRFVALARVCAGSYREWHVKTMPFSKPLHDLATLLMRMRVEPSGPPVASAARSFWSEVFGNGRDPGRALSRSSRTKDHVTPRGWRTPQWRRAVLAAAIASSNSRSASGSFRTFPRCRIA